MAVQLFRDRENRGSARRRPSADQVERTFTWGVVLYVILRAVPIWKPLQDGNANPWIFLALDLGTAYPYAKSFPRVVRHLSARRIEPAIGWLAILLGSFVIPYLYVAIAGDEVASWVWGVLAAFIAVGLVSLAIRLRSELRS